MGGYPTLGRPIKYHRGKFNAFCFLFLSNSEDLCALCPVESVVNPQKSPLAIYLPQPDGTSYNYFPILQCIDIGRVFSTKTCVLINPNKNIDCQRPC